MSRTADISRKTKETSISLSLDLDGQGEFKGSSSIGFMDHMLELWCCHSGFDLQLEMSGDRQIDDHHSVEDLGICLGQAIKEALGDKRSINRYGSVLLPMDESMIQAVVDLCGRAYLVYNVPVPNAKVGSFDTELAEEFFRAVAFNALLTLHMQLCYGNNSHHILEAAFKGFGRALREAVKISDDQNAIPSTKGIL